MECSICLDYLETLQCIKLINCKHIFHKSCIGEWTKNHNTCPLCRTNISNFFIAKTNINIFNKNIIIEVKENKINIYKNIINFNPINDIDKLNEIMDISFVQIKKLRVFDKMCKIYFLKINENNFKNKKKNIIFDCKTKAISFFETIKRIITQYNMNQELII
jgi:hypothetical protein